MTARQSLLFLWCFLGVQVILAQNAIRLSLDDVSFEQAISHIEELFEVEFSYAPEFFDGRRISLVADTDNLDDVLQLLVAQHDIEYKKSGTTGRILIRPRYEQPNEADKTLELRIADAKDHLPLEFVAVAVRGTKRGGYTDHDGILVLGVDNLDSNARLDLSLVGYQSQSLSLAGREKDTTVLMSREAVDLEEVVVKDRRDAVQTDELGQSFQLRNLQTSGMTGGLAGNDILRQVQMLPGLSAHDESSAGLRIRGDEENQTLIVLDGIPIYNAGHYYGIFSSINSGFVSSMDLYKNNLPIEYGGKTAGMLNVNSGGTSSLRQTSVDLDINLLTASGNLNLPLSEKVGLLLSGRSTYGNVSNSPFSDLPQTFNETQQGVQNFTLLTRDEILSTLPDFRFNDFNAKLIWLADEKTTVDINFYNSNDFLKNDLVNEFQTRGSRGVRITNRETYSNSEEWSNLGFSTNIHSKISDIWRLHMSAFYTEYDNSELTLTGLERQAGNLQDQFLNENDRKNNIRDIGIKGSATANLGSQDKQFIKLGWDLQHHETDLTVNEQARQALGITRDATEFTAFSSYRLLLDSGFGMEAGLRASYYEGTEKMYYSPRMSMSYRTGDNITFKTSVGRHYQFVRELSFETFRGRTVNFWTLSGGQLDPIASTNLMAGLQWKKDRWLIDVEGFLKEEEEVVEFALLTAVFSDGIAPSNQSNQVGYIPFEGTGRSIGIDFLVSHTTPNYASFLAYTYSKSTQSFRRILQGRDFPSSLDRRHQLKWANEYKTGPFVLSGNLVFSSGRPYTDIALLDPNLNRDELRPEDRISRLPDYARIDLGGQYNFKLGIADASLGLSVYNLMNRRNVKYLQYIFSVPSVTLDNQSRTINTIIGTQSDLLPRTINLVFKLSW